MIRTSYWFSPQPPRLSVAALWQTFLRGCLVVGVFLGGATQPLQAHLFFHEQEADDEELPGLLFYEDPNESHDFTLLGTAWDPGPNNARFTGVPAPGSATFSIMGGGLGDGTGFHTNHGANQTVPITNLIAGSSVADFVNMIDAVLDLWDAPSGFTNLGFVADGGVDAGALQFSGGHLGDIRVAAWEISTSNVLAHAFSPGTQAEFGVGGTIAGDVHIDVNRSWVNSATPGGSFDLFTVFLHELGHSLGLGHSTDPTSVMAPSYLGPKRTLTADDIAGIQAIYGVPEPSSFILLLIAGALVTLTRLRRATSGGLGR